MMRMKMISSLVLFGLALSACGGSTPPAETPEAEPAPAAEAPAAEPAAVEAAPEAAAPEAAAPEAARPLNVELLRASFKLVTEREPKLTDIFYGHLHTDYPDSKVLFKGVNLKKQGKMLSAALGGVVEHLEDPEWLTTNLGKMGKRHVGYGVKPEHYNWVGASLVKTLKQVAGKDWTPEMEQAWGDAYAAITKLMLAGADAA